MEVNAKILWTETMTTLAINHFKQLSSMLVLLQMELKQTIFDLDWVFNLDFDLIRLNIFNLKQTSLTSRNIVIVALFWFDICTAFDSIFQIRSYKLGLINSV